MKLTANLFNLKSLEQLKKDLESYRDSLQSKCERYIDNLVNLGENVALQKISESPIGNTVSISSTRTIEETGCQAIIKLVGESNEDAKGRVFYTALAIEFGAGSYYNKTENPKASDLGFGVGTFPGQTHAFEDGWYYLGADNEWHYSHGVKATMPMYSASQEIINNYLVEAKKVFKSG